MEQCGCFNVTDIFFLLGLSMQKFGDQRITSLLDILNENVSSTKKQRPFLFPLSLSISIGRITVIRIDENDPITEPSTDRSERQFPSGEIAGMNGSSIR